MSKRAYILTPTADITARKVPIDATGLVEAEQIDVGYLNQNYKAVADQTERDAIPSYIRKEGFVAIQGNSDRYVLQGGITNDDWVYVGSYITYYDQSKTIYISPTGSDITGDGETPSTAFQTINKVLSSILGENAEAALLNSTITISFEAGTYDFSVATKALINQIHFYNSTLAFVAETRDLEVDSFTLATTSEPLRYDVTATGQTWTLDQYKGYYATSGNGSYYPITYNSAGTDTMTMDLVNHNLASANEIYSLNVAFTNTDSSGDFMDFVALSSDSGIIYFEGIEFNCGSVGQYLTSSNLKNLFVGCTINVNGVFRIQNCCYEFRECMVHGTFNNATQALLWADYPIGDLSEFNRIFVWNEGTAIVVHTKWCEAIFYDLVAEGTGGICCTAKNMYCRRVTKIVGATYAFNMIFIDGTIKSNEGATLMLYNCTNIINAPDKKGINIIFDDYYTDGTPNLFVSGQEIELVNPKKGLRIDWPGLYQEFDNGNFTLTDNTTTTITIGSTDQNSKIVCDYYVSRGSGYRSGRLTITTDGTTPLINDVEDANSGDAEVSSANLDFNNAIHDTDGLIKVNCILSSSGNDASLDINFNRVMI